MIPFDQVGHSLVGSVLCAQIYTHIKVTLVWVKADQGPLNYVRRNELARASLCQSVLNEAQGSLTEGFV